MLKLLVLLLFIPLVGCGDIDITKKGSNLAGGFVVFEDASYFSTMKECITHTRSQFKRHNINTQIDEPLSERMHTFTGFTEKYDWLGACQLMSDKYMHILARAEKDV